MKTNAVNNVSMIINESLINGPWRVEEDNSISTYADMAICKPVDCRRKDEQKVIANMIASTPMLLNACKHAHLELSLLVTTRGDLRNAWNLCISKLARAIDKAEGR